ncbi:MAG: hypothetical protein JO199_11240 [Candidatus Eremiobacteraeota bacterium]|nr:hypothetical protein [Candidatus Eremiobacteraeota bacterium]
MLQVILAIVTLVFVGDKPQSALARSGIPVLLPRTFPSDAVQTTGGKIYTTVTDVADGSYKVLFDYTADCGGADACTIGSMEGGVDDAGSGGQTVTLKNGLAAHFHLFGCGASCGASTIVFDYKDTTYRLSLKAGSKEDTVAAANSLFPPR